MINRRDVLLAGAAVAAVAMVPAGVVAASVPLPVPVDTTKLTGYDTVLCLEDLGNGLVRLDQIEVVYAGPIMLPMAEYDDWAGQIAHIAGMQVYRHGGPRNCKGLLRNALDTLRADGRLRDWSEKDHMAPIGAWWSHRIDHSWRMPVRVDPFEEDLTFKPFKWHV